MKNKTFILETTLYEEMEDHWILRVKREEVTIKADLNQEKTIEILKESAKKLVKKPFDLGKEIPKFRKEGK